MCTISELKFIDLLPCKVKRHLLRWVNRTETGRKHWGLDTHTHTWLEDVLICHPRTQSSAAAATAARPKAMCCVLYPPTNVYQHILSTQASNSEIKNTTETKRTSRRFQRGKKSTDSINISYKTPNHWILELFLSLGYLLKPTKRFKIKTVPTKQSQLAIILLWNFTTFKMPWGALSCMPTWLL